MYARATTGQSRFRRLLKRLGLQSVPSVAEGVVESSCETVADVQVGKLDRAGQVIRFVYAKDPLFAVYGTDEGPQVQFADEESDRAKQRKAFASVDHRRVEIATLLRQWRGFAVGGAETRVAGALCAALRDDVKGALATLDEVKLQVVAERQLRGRAWSLGFSFAIAVFVLIIPLLVTLNFASADLRPWCRVAIAGTVGALFSSTIAVREKTSPANLNKLENFVDGASRVFIGATAAAVLLLLFKSGLVPEIKIGKLTLNEKLSDDNVLVIGFVAGFLERLVPDFLSKKS